MFEVNTGPAYVRGLLELRGALWFADVSINGGVFNAIQDDGAPHALGESSGWIRLASVLKEKGGYIKRLGLFTLDGRLISPLPENALEYFYASGSGRSLDGITVNRITIGYRDGDVFRCFSYQLPDCAFLGEQTRTPDQCPFSIRRCDGEGTNR